MNRRTALESARAGPALIAAVPADAIDLDALIAHLTARGFEGGISIADPETDAVLWIHDGAPQEAWFLEATGTEAVLPAAAGRDLLRQVAARGGMLAVLTGVPAMPAWPAGEGELTPADATAAGTAPATLPLEPAGAEPTASAGEFVASTAVTMEPPAHPWPQILSLFVQRLARLRGRKLASRFLASLNRALAPHGGRVEDGQVVAPPLPEATWRRIVETACASIVAVVGRGFVDGNIAAAEQELRQASRAGEGR
ncbi:MAG: hypothetical protein QN183_11950 [Armatimonadota bacterium]|nr:hypothetical protein [Armatimonadota bacterium]MDR7537062.1 hypothetical protein [Armatimonadota bacterium]